MKTLTYFFLFLVALISPLQTFASDVWFEETMYSSGKIYVVTAVFAVVLLGIFIYLVMIDRKLKKLEEENNNKA
jgi:CcmD family protein